MTPRERIMAVLAGQPTDRVPFNEIFFGHVAVSEYFGGPQKTMRDAARYLYNSGQCSILPAGFWWAPSSEYHATSEGTQRYAGGHPWTMEEVEAMAEPDVEPAFERIEEGIAAAREFGLAVHIFLMNGFHSASTTMGLENLCYVLYDTPEVLHRFIERVETFNRKMLRRLAQYDIDFIFFDGDCAYKNGLMIAPDMFREVWHEQTHETVKVCQDYGWPYCYHTDGKIDEVYPLLIELGFSGTHGVESAANDLVDIKARFGKEITLFGNFDIVDLAMRTPEEIAAMTRRMLEAGSPGGRYVAACNTLPGNDIPLENYLAFRDTIVNYSGVPA
jgi:uroporphyrinogen-III decarboxylase